MPTDRIPPVRRPPPLPHLVSLVLVAGSGKKIWIYSGSTGDAMSRHESRWI